MEISFSSPAPPIEPAGVVVNGLPQPPGYAKVQLAACFFAGSFTPSNLTQQRLFGLA
jgi:hypothetical protein